MDAGAVTEGAWAVVTGAGAVTGLRRFHPAYSVQLMRRWLAVCLLPLLNALRAFDLAAFRAALWQEGALLLALAAAAVFAISRMASSTLQPATLS